MAYRDFYGGVMPYDGKDISKNKQVKTLFPDQGDMVFPLLQHVGRMSVPVVHPGDYVRTGQLIARADTELSANLHASVSGRVVSIQDMPDTEGRMVPSIIIENDGVFLEVPYPPDRRIENLTRDTVLQTIRNAGIVGMGGSGVPTAFKLRSADEADIDTVIANCVECEPYETSDYRRILENPWKIINGLMILLTVFPGARGYIAVAESNVKGYQLLKGLLKDNDRIYVKRVSDRYPQGSERQLIYTLTGRTLNARLLPYEIGCLCFNTDTLVAINQAAIMNEPLITRIVTVTGDAAAHPGNFRVRIGMSYREVLEQAGGLKGRLHLRDVIVLNGGPMMGSQIVNLDAPITKQSSAIVCLRRESIAARPETPCTRCGRCLDACPMHLSPIALYKDIQREDAASFTAHNGLECCDCGCCSYICPSHIELTARIGEMRRDALRNPQLAGRYARRL